MNLESILKYQEVDLNLRKLEEEIERSQDYSSALAARNAFMEARKKAESTEKEAEKIVQLYQRYKEITQDLVSKSSEIEALIAEEHDSDSLEILADQLEKIFQKLSSAENDINKINTRIEEVLKVNRAAKKLGLIKRQEYADAKKKFDELKGNLEPKMDEIRAQLSKIEKDKNFDKNLFSKYTRLRKDKKLPAFVPVTADNRCSGCMMELSMNKVDVLKRDNITECESCNRMIFLIK